MYPRFRTVRDLDLFSYEQKLRHFTIEDPWNPESGPLRFNGKAPNFTVSFMGGEISRMTPLVGRPCFGILTALLRFRHAEKHVRGRGYMPNSRCARNNSPIADRTNSTA